MTTPFLSDYLKVVEATADIPAVPTDDPGTSPEMIAFCFDAQTQTLSFWDPVAEERLTISLGGSSLTDTDDLAEGATNLYYTNARADTRIALAFAAADTGDIAEGSNLYYTDERAQDAVGLILVDGTTVNFAYNDGVPSITAEVQNIAVSHFAANVVDDDDTLAADSSTRIPTQAAVKGYVDAQSADWELIDQASPSGTATVTFTGIPSTYKCLKIVGMGRSLAAGTGTDAIKMQFNNDTGANYFQDFGIFSSIGSFARLTGVNQGQVGELPKAGDIADFPCTFEITIPFYANTTFNKGFHGQYGTFNGAANSSSFAIAHTGWWDDTSAISEIDLITTTGSNWVTGSEVRLYAMR